MGKAIEPVNWRNIASAPITGEGPVKHPRLPRDSDLGNLVLPPHLPHTRLTYHRTWETGLEAEIRVAAFNPAFFAPDSR